MTFSEEEDKLTVITDFLYPCPQSRCCVFLWFCWNVRRGMPFPLAVLGQLTFQGTPPHSKRIHSGKHTADKSAALKKSQCCFVDLNLKKNFFLLICLLDTSTNWSRWCGYAAWNALHTGKMRTLDQPHYYIIWALATFTKMWKNASASVA